MSDWEDLTPKKAADGWEELPTRRKGRLEAVGDAFVQATVGPKEALASLATGSVAAPLAGLAGIAGAVLPGPQGQSGDFVHGVQEALTYQPRTKYGQKVNEAVAYPFEKLAQGADAAGQVVVDATGSPSAGAGLNTAIQAAPAVLGKVLSPAAKRAAVLERTRQEVAEKLNAPRDKIIEQSREAGYVLPPAEANPSLLNRILEGFSGQPKVQLLASTKNQPITNKIARRGLGIPDDVPISLDSLADVRRKAGQAYENVRGVGDIAIDAKYGSALDKIVEKYEGAAKSFKDEPSPVQKAVESARNTVEEGKFDASAAVDKINIERGKADKAFKQGDADLGKAHKAIADAIEQQIDRHLDVSGLPPEAIAEMRKARELIAKSYDVQKSLKGNDVDARVLAAQLRKGKPMTGELRTAAEFADRFKGAAQTGGKNADVGPTIFDAGLGLGAAGSETGGIASALVTAGVSALRPAIRSAVTSGPYQRAAVGSPSYSPSAFRRLSEAATTDEALAAMAATQAQQRR